MDMSLHCNLAKVDKVQKGLLKRKTQALKQKSKAIKLLIAWSFKALNMYIGKNKRGTIKLGREQ